MSDRIIMDFSDKAVQRHMKKFIAGLEGLHTVEFSKCRNQRTLAQNSMFHGVWLPILAKRVSELCGERIEPAQVKAELKYRFLKSYRTNKDGEPIGEYIRDTHDLDIEEFSRFMDQVHKFAAEQLDETLPEARRMETV